jgi:hypothetical protein
MPPRPALGAALATVAGPGDALPVGELGAGDAAGQGLGAGLGVADPIVSLTFALWSERLPAAALPS